MTKSKTYHHVSRYFFTRSSNADLRGGGEDVVVINGEQLPEIPKATMNMRTYIQRMYRSSVRSTVKTGTMRSYGDLSSVSDDYHAQLRELDVVKPQ